MKIKGSRRRNGEKIGDEISPPITTAMCQMEANAQSPMQELRFGSSVGEISLCLLGRIDEEVGHPQIVRLLKKEEIILSFFLMYKQILIVHARIQPLFPRHASSYPDYSSVLPSPSSNTSSSQIDHDFSEFREQMTALIIKMNLGLT